MPPFSRLLEQGNVSALNFPVAMNAGRARAFGTLMKQDFQRAVFNRIPLMKREPARRWWEILFFAMNIKASPQWRRAIQPAMRSSSRYRAKPNALRS
jgi:hypothetical protein